MVLQGQSTIPPRHVDRKELYTDLEARIRYLQHFLGFGTDDVAALHVGAKYIKAMAPTLVDRVYSKLLETDITARVFRTRSTASEEHVDSYPTFESSQIQRRRMFLRWYMTKLCSDPTRIEFWKYLNQVGRMHDGKDRMLSFDVEYIHIGACLGFVQDVIIEAVMGLDVVSFPFRLALVRALGKVIWIQNDLFARWRVRDGQEFDDEIEAAHHDPETELKPKTTKPAPKDRDDSSSIKTTWSAQTEPASLFSNMQSVETASTRTTIPANSASQVSVCPFALDFKQTFETKVWSGQDSGHR
ncbi:hypothetical protein BO70DRAFT_427032 [Aspergillus heteromorphus CBS 117.55]|uniref:Globin-sensor domain-containing protein n=1 Tax=Aspergillus heteromorphus CBS 117.55 TaxID=1448321 RepID=A0A317WSQ5_9EURO|nr:uncharacterized protein BO70DRAFT_427032 [Aspergillus heteromorphus CBS 117.55]PWY88207.1 hypothetical protein BO70DRAFT_427032 [Aspergillus heteromorphus CBS 117.55]